MSTHSDDPKADLELLKRELAEAAQLPPTHFCIAVTLPPGSKAFVTQGEGVMFQVPMSEARSFALALRDAGATAAHRLDEEAKADK
jgi:hypothetical protein